MASPTIYIYTYIEQKNRAHRKTMLACFACQLIALSFSHIHSSLLPPLSLQYETHNETLTSSLKRSELQKRDLEESLHSLEGQLQDMRGREEVLTRVEREREQRTEGLAHISREVSEWVSG